MPDDSVQQLLADFAAPPPPQQADPPAKAPNYAGPAGDVLNNFFDPTGEARLREARARQADKDEPLGEFALRRAVPFLSSGIAVGGDVDYKRSMARIAGGQGESVDFERVARYERLKEIEAKKGLLASVGSAVARIPALAGEFAATGGIASGAGRLAAAGVGRAAGEGLAARGAGYLAQTATQAAVAPGLALESASQRSVQQGGEITDLKNAAPALAMATLQTAVLGRIAGRFAGKGLAPGALAATTAAGVGEQQAVDLAGGLADEVLPDAYKTKTRYGLLGNAFRGEWGEAGKALAVQSATFAAFAAAHGLKADPVKEVAADLDAAAKAGFSREAAVKAAQEELSRKVEEATKPPEQVPEPGPAAEAPPAPTPAPEPPKTPREALDDLTARRDALDRRVNDAQSAVRGLAGTKQEADARKELAAARRDRKSLQKDLDDARDAVLREPAAPQPPEGPQEAPGPTIAGQEATGGQKATETALGDGGGFQTEKGSTYQLHGDGTTTRNKAARDLPGHEGDSGPKERSERTVYVPGNVVSALSSAGLSNVGPKGSRLVIANGNATLLTWNEKAGKWGSAPSGTGVPVSDKPAVGLHPLELWGKIDDVGVKGVEAYKNQHAGSRITELSGPPPGDARGRNKAAGQQATGGQKASEGVSEGPGTISGRRRALLERLKAAAEPRAEEPAEGPPPGVLTDAIRSAGLEGKTAPDKPASEWGRFLEYPAPDPKDSLTLSAQWLPEKNRVELDFKYENRGVPGLKVAAKAPPKATAVSLLRDLGRLAGEFKKQGVGIEYLAERKRHELYSRGLERAGYQLTFEQDRPGGFRLYVWEPAGTSMAAEARPGPAPPPAPASKLDRLRAAQAARRQPAAPRPVSEAGRVSPPRKPNLGERLGVYPEPGEEADFADPARRKVAVEGLLERLAAARAATRARANAPETPPGGVTEAEAAERKALAGIDRIARGIEAKVRTPEAGEEERSEKALAKAGFPARAVAEARALGDEAAARFLADRRADRPAAGAVPAGRPPAGGAGPGREPEGPAGVGAAGDRPAAAGGPRGPDTSFDFGANAGRGGIEEPPPTGKNLFGEPLPRTFAGKKSVQPTIEDYHRETRPEREAEAAKAGPESQVSGGGFPEPPPTGEAFRGGVPGIPGMTGGGAPGGAPRKEFALARAKVTGERAETRREAVAAAARHSNPQAWAEAVAAVRADPQAAAKLVDALEANPRPTTQAENALLLQRRVALANEYEGAVREYLAAREQQRFENGRLVPALPPEQLEVLRRRADDLLAGRDRLDRVTAKVGTELGRGLQFFRQLAREDYGLGSMLNQARAARGRDLTPAEEKLVVERHEAVKAADGRQAAAESGERAAAAEGARGDAADVRIAARRARAEFAETLASFRRANQSAAARVLGGTLEAFNASRAFITAFDLSAVFRQGGFLSFAHPVKALRAAPEMLHSFASERAFERAQDAIRQRPNYALYQRAKLYLADHAGPPSAQEEAFMGRWVRRVPGVAGSERAYTAFLNRIRADVFDSLAASARGGRPTPDEARALANFVNVATGRGPLGPLERAAVPLAQVFFSPRYAASRFQVLAGQPFYGGSAATRWLVAREYARALAGVAVFYGVMRLANKDAEISFDPRSADFGKVKLGRTRIDPLTGLGQVAVFETRLASGETKSTETGKVSPLRGSGVKYGGQNEGDVIGRFLRSKLAPVPGAVMDVLTGKDVVGQPVTAPVQFPGGRQVTQPQAAAALKETGQVAVPISVRDVWDALKDQGVPRGVAVSLLAILGMATQTYEPRVKKAG